MKKTITFKNLYLTINLIFSTAMLFYELLPSLVVMLMLFFFIMWSVICLKKRIGFFLSLVYTAIAMIPTSFISIIGKSTSSFPIVWYHILVIWAVFFYIRKEKVDRVYCVAVIFFSVYGLCTSLLQSDIGDSIKQVLMIILFLCSFFIGKCCLVKTDKEKFFFLYKLYIIGAVAVALQVLIQFFLLNYMGLSIGRIGYYANRTAYAGLLGDYSFATTYIATGFMAVFLGYFRYEFINFAKFVVLEVILMSGMLTVTARAGLYALAITIILYIAMHLKHLKIRYIFVIIVAFLVSPLIIDILMGKRGGQALLSDSGRMDEYIIAIRIWLEHVLFGIGFGLEHLKRKCNISVPHNFFIQYLLQGGLVGIILILRPFIRFIKGIAKSVDSSIWLFVLVCISAMVIPDVVNSRFFSAIIILNYMSCFKYANS